MKIESLIFANWISADWRRLVFLYYLIHSLRFLCNLMFNRSLVFGRTGAFASPCFNQPTRGTQDAEIYLEPFFTWTAVCLKVTSVGGLRG
ncbi:hypothetical protein Pla144_43740 [Bythopirellula polymerisocia]|uniref:Uncharacterized protein n=1 Tax=Bythopirellula polymerisocia TaxID=2528003 RepID=A0A5C6CDS4_9BACT|nr:hypothetical protein Pla144_43740 [Bythopirellula polymerisocia]